MKGYDAFLGILSAGEMLSLSSAKFASPLGLNVLGTKIKQRFPDRFVRIYNLEINDREAVMADIVGQAQEHKRILVGLSLIAGNVFRSLQLAEYLKTKHSNIDIIVGGPEVTEETAEHFASLAVIDGLVVGFGEHVIGDIIENGIKQKIYRTPPYFDFLNAAVDYRLLFRLEDYGGVSMLWAGDCHLCNQRCYFCSRQKRGFGWRPPTMVWDEVHYPYQQGIRKLYNTADTVAVDQQQLRWLVETKPAELTAMKIKCFINATQVNDETASLLQKLNAWAAVGIETCSRIDTVGKGGTRPDDNLRAIKTLERHGVPMILTFVMGLPGETAETLKIDKEAILSIVEEHRSFIYWVTVSPLLITLGSRAFKDCLGLLKNSLPRQDVREYYNPFLLTERYFHEFCPVGLDEIYHAISELKKEIGGIAPAIIFDSKGLDPQRWRRAEE